MSAPNATIGVVGLGQMGAPLARTLLRAGFRVVAWDVNCAAVESAATYGAVPAADLAAVARETATVLTSLPNAAIVREVALGEHGFVRQAAPGGMLVDLSTTTPGEARALAADLAEFGWAFLDAPVSGGTSGAASGTLTVMVGGPADIYARAEPVLRAIGSKVTHCGPAGAGQVAKACNQLIVMATLEAVAEALTLASEAGLDVARIHEALLGGYADSPILKIQGERMLTRNFEPGGRTKYNLKDISTIDELAGASGIELPVFAAAAAQFRRLVDRGAGDLDNAAIITVVERPAGRVASQEETSQ